MVDFMTPDNTSMICQGLMRNSSFMSLLTSAQTNAASADNSQQSQSFHSAFQNQLLQTVFEEKIKNEILMATVLINSKIIEIQNQIVHEAQSNVTHLPALP